MALLDELRAMAIFATVVRCGSFAAAARELALTRAVVSHHVGALEARLGVPLAYRSTRSFSLTPAGEAFRVHCERLLDEASDGLRGMELLRAEPQGEVRLTCSHHFGNKRILPALLAFRRRYPAIRLHIVMGDANVDLVQQGVDLVQQGVDLAVRAGPLPDSTLYARPLVREATLLCASPAYVKRYGMPTTAAALKEHRWVIYPPSQRQTQIQIDGERIDIPVQGDIVTDSAVSRLAFVLAGEGIARLPGYDAAAPLAAGELVQVLPQAQTAPLEIYLVHSKKIGPSTRLLRDFLLEVAREGGW
ncbi:LysR family transcriptional regulator [Xanthomonas campestris pv. campestris]|uniref:LysR family transcriptional regulator n=1 Tax=Xanthomonas campestris TaxID=339 RepID=UPI002368F29D|nr:LysR family transcriptional regulator [Xanthomonas campestris]WDJ98110.1 LysR family transcriptional regulator [Xanthomonas campestris pv. incanae]